MRQLLASAIFLVVLVIAGCQNNVPNHKDAWLSYKYGLDCGGYTAPQTLVGANPCGLDNVDAANTYYENVGIANPFSYSFTNWVADNGFPATASAHATYANLADLQFGRDMYCAQVGQKIECYVTNYGPPAAINYGDAGSYFDCHGWCLNPDWPNISSALTDAVQGNHPFGIVAMIYDPSKPGGSQVSFYAFDADSTLIPAPALDGDGPKTLPRMCMACHGGTYDTSSNTVTGASFLPFDPFNFRYPKGSSYSFDAQQESLRKLNALVLATNPNQPIIDLINGLYPNGVTNVGSTPLDGYVPPGWSDNPTLYTGVVRPYCRTCHLAQTLSFTSSSDFEGEPGTVQNMICTTHDMPHAQVPFGISHPGLGTGSNGQTVGFWNDAVAQRDFGNFFKSQGVASCLPAD